MNNIPNRKAICDMLLEQAANDRDIVVLCSDSRGSASMAPFFEAYPNQSVEVGIAEQNLVRLVEGGCRDGRINAESPFFINLNNYKNYQHTRNSRQRIGQKRNNRNRYHQHKRECRNDSAYGTF